MEWIILTDFILPLITLGVVVALGLLTAGLLIIWIAIELWVLGLRIVRRAIGGRQITFKEK